MARRKSRRAATTKPPMKQMKLDTVFKCPLCDHPSNVECTTDLKHRIAEIDCWFCQRSYVTTITALTEPVDIYHEWVDECERPN